MTIDIDSFVRDYGATALWSSSDESDPETGGDPLDKNYGPEDIDPESSAAMAEDCEAFLNALLPNGETVESRVRRLAETGAIRCSSTLDAWGHVAHDFWLTRNGHGAGFWDGDYPESDGDELSTVARSFGECNLFVNGDQVTIVTIG